jgi:hypothetical protein
MSVKGAVDPVCGVESKLRAILQRKHYNTIRPHSSLGYRPPTPQASILSPTPLEQVVPMQ